MHFISKKYSKQKIKQVASDLEEFKNDFEKFKNYWNELFADFYIEDDKNLECILNSNDEDNPYGKQISKYYKDIIETHNKYISNFIDCVQKNKLSKY